MFTLGMHTEAQTIKTSRCGFALAKSFLENNRSDDINSKARALKLGKKFLKIQMLSYHRFILFHMNF